ncbi:hypothetical protein [Dawidia cretensis]|nr:hypothetical protein [Dawidia cretensis]
MRARAEKIQAFCPAIRRHHENGVSAGAKKMQTVMGGSSTAAI